MAITTPASKPRYAHDCRECFFLGTDTPRTKAEGGSYVDLYYHPGWKKGTGAMTRRWGPDRKQHAVLSMERYNRLEVKPPEWIAVFSAGKKLGHEL